jgi:hypothetical protein
MIGYEGPATGTLKVSGAFGAFSLPTTRSAATGDDDGEQADRRVLTARLRRQLMGMPMNLRRSFLCLFAVALVIADAPIPSREALAAGSICLDGCRDREALCARARPEALCADAFHACRRKCYHMPLRRRSAPPS